MIRPAPFLIQIDRSPGEHRIALLHDGALAEYFVYRPGAPDGIGDVHVARVTAIVPAMAGAFVALHDAEAFLPDSEGAAGLSEGALVIVRITRAAQGSKGPRVSARTGSAPPVAAVDRIEGPVRLLARGPSPLEELQSAYPGAPVVEAPFDETLDDEIAAVEAPTVTLEGGLVAHVSPTPALVAIDLDGAGTSAGRASKAAAQMAVNRTALPSLVRQIVLRNLSGAIVIDFAGLASRKRQSLAPALEAALAADRLRPRLAGFSPLGFAEIARPRLRPPLHELLDSPLSIGLAALRRAAAESQTAPGRRLALRAAPAVIAALQADACALPDLARVTTHPLVLRSDPTLRRVWFIEDNFA